MPDNFPIDDPQVIQNLGKRIAALRNMRRLSRAEFAELAVLDQGQLDLIEEGKVDPAIESVFKIAVALDVPVSFLFEK